MRSASYEPRLELAGNLDHCFAHRIGRDLDETERVIESLGLLHRSQRSDSGFAGQVWQYVPDLGAARNHQHAPGREKRRHTKAVG